MKDIFNELSKIQLEEIKINTPVKAFKINIPKEWEEKTIQNDEEFNKFLNRSLLASGKRCIRVEREGIHGNSTYTMYFSDIVINTKKETRLYIADVDEKQ